MKMQFEVSHSLRVRPGGTKSFVSMSILLLVACAAFIPSAPVVAAENGRVQAAPAGDERPADRRRWWLNIWAHSMQETCFITWMDTQFGGQVWQWVLPAQQVNSIYVWWIVAVWEQPNGK
jgi:hypothetical protein